MKSIITTYESLYVYTVAISARRNYKYILLRYLDKYLEPLLADMDMNDTVKIYSMKKHYDGGGIDGHYVIMINPVTLTSAELCERYDLSASTYKFDGYTGTGITLGMKKGGTGIWDLNDVASILFNKLLFGEVVFTFEGIDEQRATLPVMRRQLEEGGMPPENINF